MNIAPGKHPAREVLQAFGLGKLDDASITQVSLHLETCVDCKRQVAELSGDSLLQKLRQANGPAGTPAPGQTMAPLAPPKASQPLSAPPNSVPPELLNNPQYEIIRELGAGGMGVVYLAKNKLMDRLEVLKVISTAMVHKTGVLDRFLREIRAAASLSHDNVVKAYAALQMGDLLVFAMEYVEGDDLAKVVKIQGPLAVANACYYARQVALGLQHAHDKGMVHRDIKPHNLILARVGKRHIVKILDFGLAKAASEKKLDAGLTGEGKMLGTPDYMAPEQILDAATADIRADIYSLGCTLYYLLSGVPPFDANSLFELLQAHQTKEARPLNLVRPEVPVELAVVVAKMMAKEPAKRYQKPVEIAQALTPFFMKRAGIETALSPPADERVKAEPRRPEVIAKRSETIATPPSETLVPSAKAAADWWASEPEPRGQNPIPQEAKANARVQKRVKPLLTAGVAIAVGVVFLGLLLWGAGVLRMNTPEGTIVLENVPEGADVFVDGGKVTVKTPGPGEPLQITVKAGKRKLEVRQGNVTFYSGDVAVDVGARLPVQMRLEPVAKGKGKKGETPTVIKRFPVTMIPADFKAKRLWRLEGEELVQDLFIPNSVDTDASIFFGDSSWTDYDFTVEAKMIHGNDAFGLWFRQVKANNRLPNAYIYCLGGYFNKWHLVDWIENGKVARLRTHSIVNNPLEQGSWYVAKVSVRGDKGQCFLNGVSFFDFVADKHAAGCVGLCTWAAAYRFKNIKVTAPDGTVLLEGLPDLESDRPTIAVEQLGFKSLFNGKDLTGWKTHPSQPGNWRVNNGVVVGSGQSAPTHLYTERGDYSDFHLRVDARFNDGGNSGVIFRSRFGPKQFQLLDGFEAEIMNPPTVPNATGTGSLLVGYKAMVRIPKSPVPAYQWFTMDIIAEGNRIIVKVEGKTTADYTDVNRLFTSGHIALQQYTRQTVAEFRKIEIKEPP